MISNFNSHKNVKNNSFLTIISNINAHKNYTSNSISNFGFILKYEQKFKEIKNLQEIFIITKSYYTYKCMSKFF